MIALMFLLIYATSMVPLHVRSSPYYGLIVVPVFLGYAFVALSKTDFSRSGLKYFTKGNSKRW